MRRPLAFLPLALLITVLVEIGAFILLGQAIGYGWTFLLLVTMSIAGVLLVRREGMKAWRRFRDVANAGRPPGEQVTDGVVGLGAGLLLAIPGLVTGLIGLLLAIPPFRTLARGATRRFTERRVSSAVAGDLFGPRRVKVRRGRPSTSGEPTATAEPTATPTATITATPGAPVVGEVVEGEIVEPRRLP